MIVDSHCHLDRLNLSDYQGDLNLALDAAKQNGVEYFLCVSIDLETFPQIALLAERYPDRVAISAGLHPNDHPEYVLTQDKLLDCVQHPKVVAVGETGLDYFRSEGDITWQQERFRTHIAVAKQKNKPLIIHTRQAQQDTIMIMQDEGANAVGGVMHCFSESKDMAEKCLDLGFYISFSGMVTFHNASELKEVAKYVPLDRMLIETDAPYLAPVPHRGKPNEPAYVRHVAEYIAELRQLPLETIAKYTTDNFYNLFNIQRLTQP